MSPTHKPWRKVAKKLGLGAGRGSILGPDTTRRTHWWNLKLECGHEVERTVKYKPREDGRIQRRNPTQISGRRSSATQKGPL